MRIKRLAVAGLITLTLTPTVFADGISQSVDGLEANVDSLEAQVSALQTENAALQSVIVSLTSVVDDLVAGQSALVDQQRCHALPGTLQANGDDNYAGGVDWHGCDKTGLSMWGPKVGGAETDVLVNADLRDVNFTLVNLIGIYAGGANLDGARIVNSNLAYSDFTGANITPSTVFINVGCPDETNSDTNGGTCVGHMTPKF